MPGDKFTGSGKTYLSIVNGGFVQNVKEGTAGSERREYEKKDGSKGIKFEIKYQNWSGIIRNISFKDTDFGEMCNIEFDDAIISLPTKGRYFSDFAKKIQGANLKKHIKLHPYDFEVEGGKKKTGISMTQGDTKLQNYYFNPTTQETLHGFPIADNKTGKKSYWEIYFGMVREFLVEQIGKLEFEESEPQDDAKPALDELDELFKIQK